MKRKVALLVLGMSLMTSIVSNAGTWNNEDGKWYYLNEANEKVSGFITDNNMTYYLDPFSYELKTGIQDIGGKTYYFSDDGHMNKGWVKSDHDWYYYGDDGALIKGSWVHDGDSWYYTDNSGKIIDGLQEIGGKKYYFSQRNDSTYGKMIKGWVKSQDKSNNTVYYYFGDDGAAVTTSITENDTVYNFNASGNLVKDKNGNLPSVSGNVTNVILYTIDYKSDKADEAKAKSETRAEINKYIDKMPNILLNDFFNGGKIEYYIDKDYIEKKTISLGNSDYTYDNFYDDDEDTYETDKEDDKYIYELYRYSTNRIEACQEPINVLRGFGRYIDEKSQSIIGTYKAAGLPSGTNEFEKIFDEEKDNLSGFEKISYEDDTLTAHAYFDICYALYRSDNKEFKESCPNSYNYVKNIEGLLMDSIVESNTENKN